MNRSSRYTLLALCALIIACGVIWYANFAEDRRDLLAVHFLNVGQGDATFIDVPSGRQMLIDGGPGSSVLRELSRVMPWYDRTIDVVVATHPDSDHIEGLIDVLERYDVSTIVISSVKGTTALSATLDSKIKKERATVVVAERGHIIDLGKGAQLRILFPDREVPSVATNVGCIIGRLTYGDTSFMLPCDTTSAIEEYITMLDPGSVDSDVLKAAHHGSKTSSAPAFVAAVSPAYAIYSRGCGNSYGHPHQETIDTYAKLGVPTLDTCLEGAITFVSDGMRVERK